MGVGVGVGCNGLAGLAGLAGLVIQYTLVGYFSYLGLCGTYSGILSGMGGLSDDVWNKRGESVYMI